MSEIARLSLQVSLQNREKVCSRHRSCGNLDASKTRCSSERETTAYLAASLHFTARRIEIAILFIVCTIRSVVCSPLPHLLTEFHLICLHQYRCQSSSIFSHLELSSIRASTLYLFFPWILGLGTLLFRSWEFFRLNRIVRDRNLRMAKEVNGGN